MRNPGEQNIVVIEESITISAPMQKVWNMFADLTCWANWSRVLTDINAPEMCLTDGRRFRCCMRPYFFPIYIEPKVREVIPYQKVVWIAEMYGISSVHEFLFAERGEGVAIVSRETFRGIPVLLGAMYFLNDKVRKMTISFLHELRQAAEAS